MPHFRGAYFLFTPFHFKNFHYLDLVQHLQTDGRLKPQELARENFRHSVFPYHRFLSVSLKRRGLYSSPVITQKDYPAIIEAIRQELNSKLGAIIIFGSAQSCSHWDLR